MSILLALLLQVGPEPASQAAKAWTACLIEASDRQARSSTTAPEYLVPIILGECRGKEDHWRSEWVRRWGSSTIESDLAEFRASHSKSIIARIQRIRAARR